MLSVGRTRCCTGSQRPSITLPIARVRSANWDSSSITTSEPAGFSDDEIDRLRAVVTLFSRFIELSALRQTANKLMEVYLGPETGREVLAGNIKRGDGRSTDAVTWFSDLRRSTLLSETMPVDEYLSFVNRYFDAVGGAVAEAGGETLRFIGDAELAIFPVDKCATTAACHAITAVKHAHANVAASNAAAREQSPGAELIEFGSGLHIGTVHYGNIGIPIRLEFTVIGAAANHAAKIESMCKHFEIGFITSEAVRTLLPKTPFQSLGQHNLPGTAMQTELYTLPDLENADPSLNAPAGIQSATDSSPSG